VVEQQPTDDDHQIGNQLARGVDVLPGLLLALAGQEFRLIQVAVEIHVQQIEGVGERW